MKEEFLKLQDEFVMLNRICAQSCKWHAGCTDDTVIGEPEMNDVKD